MKDNTKTENFMGRVLTLMQMELFIKENTGTIKEPVMEF